MAWPWDFLALALAVCALFYLLTSGIPLVQWGLIHSACSKKDCIRMARWGILIPALTYLLVYLRWPHFFNQLGVVRWTRKMMAWPLAANVGLLFLLYCAWVIPVGFARHAALETRGFDLGIFAQAVWNTLHGDFLFSSIKENVCLLGDHVSPILALIAPLYGIWPDPRNLLILQTLAGAACLFPIAYIAKQKTGDSFVVMVFCLMYFFYLPTRGAMHEDFHPEVLVEPFLLAAFIFLEKKSLSPFLAMLLIAVTAKENMLGIAFMMGLYAFLWKRWKFIGAMIMLFSAALFVFEVKWLIPHLSGKPYLYQGFYVNIIGGSPWGIVTEIFKPKSLEYFGKIFLPFLGLPLFHWPTMMLTLPVLIQNMASNNPVMRSFGYHYTTGLTPFVFISSIYGFCAVIQKWSWIGRWKHLLAAVLLVIALVKSSPAEYFYLTDSLKHTSPHTSMVRTELAKIPSGFSVLTHNNLIPQLAGRRRIYQFDYNAHPTKGESAVKYGVDYVIFDRQLMEPGVGTIEEAVRELSALGYAEEFQNDGLYFYRKKDQAS